jgi:putative FmdB family regulatory protein
MFLKKLYNSGFSKSFAEPDMPIYAYRCDDCGFAKDVLQKISDAPLTVCEACGHPTFRKQLTAAGFQLKGTGWYVTDFRNGGSASKPAATASTGAAPSTPAASSTDTPSAPAAPVPKTSSEA